MVNLQEFLEAEKEAISKSKWVESEKARRDLSVSKKGKPTQRFYLAWVGHHAKDFRKAWDVSICKDCRIIECRFKALKECPNFIAKE